VVAVNPDLVSASLGLHVSQGLAASAWASAARRSGASVPQDGRSLEEEPLSRRRAIAVIDDDLLVRCAMVSLLRSFGLEVEAFASATTFLEVGPERWDCVVSDIHMPLMSGLELLVRLTASHPDLPVVLITGMADDQVRSRALKAGAAGFLEKLAPAETIIAAIEQAMGFVAD
jgi:two-component system response regulator FixJ